MRSNSRAIALFVVCGLVAGGCGKEESSRPPNATAFQQSETQDAAGAEATRSYVTTRDVQLRSGPGAKYKVVTEIKSGTKINVAGREGEWLKVVSRKGNPPGYVNEKDAQPLEEPWPVAKEFVPDSYFTIQETTVRRGPGSNYEQVATIPKDTKVHVVGKEKGWLKVESKHGKAPGYIVESHATRSQPGETRNIVRLAPGSYVTTEEVSVRSGPGFDFEVIARIPGDTKVTVVDSEGDWLKVQSKHGNPPGYIPAKSARES